MVERLMRVIEISCSANADYVPLILHLCIDQPITAANITILEDVFSECNTISSIVLKSQTIRGESFELRMGDPKKVMPELQGLYSQSLQEILGPYLVCQVSNYLETLQGNLCKELDASSAVDKTMLDPILYRRAIRRVSWLLPMLDTHVRNAISTVPTPEATRALITLHTDVRDACSLDHSQRKLSGDIQDHCKALITSGRIDDDVSEDMVPAMIDLWQQHLSSERQKLAMKIASREYFGLEIRRPCLSQLRILSHSIVMKILAAVQNHVKDWFIAYIEFIKMSSRDPGSNITLCWRQVIYLLFVMFDQPFIEYVIADGVARWLDLLININIVYCDEMICSSSTLLQPALQEWTSLLRERGHVQNLEFLETSLGRGHVLQCLSTGSGSQESLLQLFGYMGDSMYNYWQEVVEATVSMRRYDGSNVGALAKILSISSRTTVNGTQIFLRTLKRSQRGSRSLTVTLAAASLPAFPLKSPVYLAIRQIEHYLGLKLDPAGAPRVEDLETTSEYFEDRRIKLLAKVQRLECLRL